jgi:glyceraldehyde 3-phosphate dehydrogenase
MSVRIGINGFGRIGRNVLRAGWQRRELEFVAINDLPTPTRTLAHLLKYDSVLGAFDADVRAEDGAILVDGKRLRVFSAKIPAEVPWEEVGVDVVIESTGVFTSRDTAEGHLSRRVKKVIITAPAKNEDLTIVLGANESAYDPARHHVISNASCTTNCVVPMAKVIHERLRIERGFMTTIHSYTNDQRLLDLAHTDLRRARAAALSLIPSTTGAARMVGVVFPELKGRIDGMAIRVPTPNVSIVDLSCQVQTETSAEEVNALFRQAADGPLRGLLQYCEEPLVSRDFNGNAHSCIFDATLTAVIDKRFLKTFGWYDNEWGYSHRVVDLAAYLASKGLAAGGTPKATAAARA